MDAVTSLQFVPVLIPSSPTSVVSPHDSMSIHYHLLNHHIIDTHHFFTHSDVQQARIIIFVNLIVVVLLEYNAKQITWVIQLLFQYYCV